MFEISVPLNIKFVFSDDVTLVNLAQKVQVLGIENLVLSRLIEELDEEITVDLCGEKYSHDNEDKLFKRAGKSGRKIVTLWVN
jgi:hypothetical protein